MPLPHPAVRYDERYRSIQGQSLSISTSGIPAASPAVFDCYALTVVRIVCMPRISAIIVSACMSGCVVAGLFVLADASVRTQLQQAVIASGAPQVDRKAAIALPRVKVAPLDKQRLTSTIAMITHADSE